MIVIGVVVLLQDADAFAGRDEDIALRGLELAGQDAQEGGFAGPVRADDAVAFAWDEFDVDVFKSGVLPNRTVTLLTVIIGLLRKNA